MVSPDSKLTQHRRPRKRKRRGSPKRDTAEILDIAKAETAAMHRRQGLSWPMIAEKMGYASASGPFRLFRRYVAMLTAEALENVDEARWNEISRNEAILRGGLYQRAQKGELQAIDRFLSLQKSTREMMGLDAPKTLKAEVGEPGSMLDGNDPQSVARRVREMFGESAAVPADVKTKAKKPRSKGPDAVDGESESGDRAIQPSAPST